LAARRGSAALRLGSLRLLDAPEGVLLYERRHAGDCRRVVLGFGSGGSRGSADSTGALVAMDGDWRVEVASDGVGEGAAFDGRLAGDRALLLRPSG